MNNGLFKLGWSDLSKGLVLAVISAVVVIIASVVLAPNFDAFTVNWSIVLHNVVNGSLVAFVSYIIKNLLTDNQGNIAGFIPTK